MYLLHACSAAAQAQALEKELRERERGGKRGRESETKVARARGMQLLPKGDLNIFEVNDLWARGGMHAATRRRHAEVYNTRATGDSV